MTRRSKRKTAATRASKKQSVSEETDKVAEEVEQESQDDLPATDDTVEETEDKFNENETPATEEPDDSTSSRTEADTPAESEAPTEKSDDSPKAKDETPPHPAAIASGKKDKNSSDNSTERLKEADTNADLDVTMDPNLEKEPSPNADRDNQSTDENKEREVSAEDNDDKTKQSITNRKGYQKPSQDLEERAEDDVCDNQDKNVQAEKVADSKSLEEEQAIVVDSPEKGEETSMEVDDEVPNPSNIGSQVSTDSVINVDSSSSAHVTSDADKEPVVIEIGANDDLNEDDDTSSKNEDDSPENKPVYQVVDEIDLTKSDDEAMDVGSEEVPDPESTYVVPDYDDPNLGELEIDPERDDGKSVEETKDFLKYWHPVQDNPQEFTSWTYLLQFVEQEGKLPLARRAFNSFFCRYPLCYGYWKKFSELERKAGNLLRAQKILERGVRAIPLSIDLWVHVVDFYINYYKRPDAGKDKVRKIFDRAIDAAGQEFRSEKLWNKYAKWEIENQNWLGVVAVYDKALRAQTQHYSILFSDFKVFVNKHPPHDLISKEKFQDYLQEARKEKTADAKKEEEKNKDKKDADCEVVDKDEELDDAPPGVEEEEKPPTDDELKAIRAKIVKERKKIHDETEQLVTKIWAFEEGIKRPYFHVKQLERAQLKNWREYLDVEIARDDHERIVLLFERCLIACALYEDFWLKYTRYMAKHDASVTSKIFERACTVHLPKKPNIHSQWAAHEEQQGNMEKASSILEKLDNILPGMAMIKMRRVAVQRRGGNIQVAEDLLKSYVASAAKDKEEVFYSRKLAWFLLKISGKRDEAKKVLKDLIPKYKSELKLYNDLVEMEFQLAGNGYPANDDEEGMAMEAFNLALSCDKLSEDQKFLFSQRKLEFLEDFGRDVKHLQKVYDEHQKMVRSHKKRTQIDLTTDDNPSKKQKVDSGSIAVVGTSQVANGASYSTAPAAASTPYGAQQAYPGGDPSLYYQQQQSYWNYAGAKPADAQSPYNYSQQWSQYYNSR